MKKSSSLAPAVRLAALSAPPLAFLLLLVGIEVVVRQTRPQLSSLEALVRSSRQQADFTDRLGVGIFEGDPLLFWRLKPGLRSVIWDYTLVSTNGQGLRAQRPVGPKRPGSLRIVCLGDSVTFGYRVPLVFAERPDEYDPAWLPYPELIERRLRQANPGREIESVALAVPGYSSHQGRAWLARDIERLAPDIVTANFGWNDVGLRSVSDSRLMRTAWGRVWMRRLLVRSQALIRASLWLEARGDRQAARNRHRPRVSRDEFVENHLEMARLAREHGARALIVGPVYRDDSTAPDEAARLAAHRHALREAMTDAGIPYLEIDLLTEAGAPANYELFGELIHPNHRGHRLMANAVLESLASHGMLDGLVVPPPPD